MRDKTENTVLGKLADFGFGMTGITVSYTHLRAHETDSYLVCRLLLEKKKKEREEIISAVKPISKKEE